MKISFRMALVLAFLVAVNGAALAMWVDSDYDPTFKGAAFIIAALSIVVFVIALVYEDDSQADSPFDQAERGALMKTLEKSAEATYPPYTSLLVESGKLDLQNPARPLAGEVWRKLTTGQHVWVLFLANETCTQGRPVQVVCRNADSQMFAIPLAQWEGRYKRVIS
jgi:hypothetical protein